MAHCYQQEIVSNSRSFLSFITSRQFVIQAFLAILASMVIVFATLKVLDWYTMHGEEITVPDLKGMSKTSLKPLLEDKDLHFKVMDSSFVTEEEKGIVLAQNPEPMSKVKKNRTIYITISSSSPPSVNLPLLADRSIRQAKAMIENSGLKLGELIFVPDLCMNCVLSQKIDGKRITSDTIVPKGSRIDLVLGGGLSDERVLVPFLLNLTRDEAIKRLKGSFLNVGAELYDGTVFDEVDSSSAKVFAQHPPYGEKSWVRMGSSVDIELTMLTSKIDSIKPNLDTSMFLKFEVDTIQ